MRVGIIGTGFSANAHVDALKRLPYVEVVAVQSKTLSRAEHFANTHNIVYAFTDPYELIAHDKIDAIHNCTSNHMHYPINEYALEQRKFIISEKPLGISTSESQKLVDLAQEMKCANAVCFNYRFYPLTMQMKDMVHHQEHGAPHLIRGSYMQDWMLYEGDYNWRSDVSINGSSRAVADIGSHWIDTVQHITGDQIISVFADLSTVHPERYDGSKMIPITTEDAGLILLRFASGLKASFVISQVTAGRKNHFDMELSLTDASYYWNQEKPNRLWIGKRNETNAELLKDASLLNTPAQHLAHYPGGHQEGWPDALKNLFDNFYSSVNDTTVKKEYATFEQGHHVMKIVEAIKRSHEEEQWVRVNDEEERK